MGFAFRYICCDISVRFSGNAVILTTHQKKNLKKLKHRAVIISNNYLWKVMIYGHNNMQC